MAKKFGKILLATAAIGVAVAGAYYYMQKKEGITINPMDDDYDNFDEDLDEDCEPCRNYVPLTPEASDTEQETTGDFTPLSEQIKNMTEETIEDVEEFFDEDNV